MMFSPEEYILEMQNKTYEECIEERNRLLEYIVRFEKKEIPEEEYMYKPSPDVIYQCNLEYLSKLCILIEEKFNSMNN